MNFIHYVLWLVKDNLLLQILYMRSSFFWNPTLFNLDYFLKKIKWIYNRHKYISFQYEEQSYSESNFFLSLKIKFQLDDLWVQDFTVY